MLKANKEILVKIAIAIAVLIFIAILAWAFLQKKEEPFIPEEIIEEETIADDIEKQLKDLGELNEEIVPQSEEEIRKQLEDLGKFPLQETKTLSEEEIRKQLEEL